MPPEGIEPAAQGFEIQAIDNLNKNGNLIDIHFAMMTPILGKFRENPMPKSHFFETILERPLFLP